MRVPKNGHKGYLSGEISGLRVEHVIANKEYYAGDANKGEFKGEQKDLYIMRHVNTTSQLLKQ